MKNYLLNFFLYSSAQLQQLESRLRYSKTDKETAEKKQKILIDKDLVDFKDKLDAYEVSSSNYLKSSISEVLSRTKNFTPHMIKHGVKEHRYQYRIQYLTKILMTKLRSRIVLKSSMCNCSI